jgi:hypothetical protein
MENGLMNLPRRGATDIAFAGDMGTTSTRCDATPAWRDNSVGRHIEASLRFPGGDVRLTPIWSTARLEANLASLEAAQPSTNKTT